MLKKIDQSKIKQLGVNKPAFTQILTLYIPDRDKDGKKIKNINKWIKEAQKILTIIGGGCTMTHPANGTWINPKTNNKNIIIEKTIILYTYVDSDKFENNFEDLKQFLHNFGKETNHGEVVFEFDGVLYKIDKYQSPTD